MSSGSADTDRLLLLPLLQGMALAELLEVAEKVRFSFNQKAAGTTIVSQDDACDRLVFVIEGHTRLVHTAPDRTYQLSEWSDRPQVLQPECLFGLRTRYQFSVCAETDVQTLELEKSAVRDVLLQNTTFRINFLNLISWRAQQASRRLWTNRTDDLQRRFAQFVLQRSERPAGRKELRVTMERLGTLLGATRLNISRMLRQMQDAGLIVCRRETITIRAFEQLVGSV